MTQLATHTGGAPQSSVWMLLLWGLWIGVCGWGLYGRTAEHGYVVDDVAIVQTNPNAAADADLRLVFKKHYWQDVPADEGARRNFHYFHYRPATIASFVLVARLLGDGPRQQHLVNVVLHVLVAWLVLVNVYAWLRDTLVAGLTGLYFVVHPLHTEAVAMLVGRAEMLAALGALGALGLAQLALQRAPSPAQRWLCAIASGCCLLFGWLSKESAVLFFPLWLLVFWSRFPKGQPSRQRAWATVVWQVGLACGLATLCFWAVHQRLQAGVQLAPIDFPLNPLAYVSLAQRWATGVVLVMKYIAIHLWSFPLQVDYSYNSIPVVTDQYDRRLWIALLGCLGVVGLLWVTYRCQSPAWVGIAFLLVGTTLFAHFVRPLGFVFAERVMYLPSAGYCLVVAVGFRAAWNAVWNTMPRTIACGLPAAMVLLIGSAGWQTWREVPFYRDTRTTVAHALAVGNRQSVWLWHAYGTELLNAGHVTEAITALERAHAILPSAEGCAVRAKAYFALGQRALALNAAREAVRRDSTWAPYRELYAVLLFDNGQLDEAAAQLEVALTLLPDDGQLHAQLGVIRRHQGRLADAIHHYTLAVTSMPTKAVWWNTLGDLLALDGNLVQAQFCYRKVLEISSDVAVRREVEHKLMQLTLHRATDHHP